MDVDADISEKACRALVRLVRADSPAEHSLVEVADLWGEASDAELAALRVVEAADECLGIFDERSQEPDVPLTELQQALAFGEVDERHRGV